MILPVQFGLALNQAGKLLREQGIRHCLGGGVAAYLRGAWDGGELHDLDFLVSSLPDLPGAPTTLLEPSCGHGKSPEICGVKVDFLEVDSEYQDGRCYPEREEAFLGAARALRDSGTVPVMTLEHVLEWKFLAGRAKDLHFLADLPDRMRRPDRLWLGVPDCVAEYACAAHALLRVTTYSGGTMSDDDLLRLLSFVGNAGR